MTHPKFRVAILQNFLIEETGGKPMIDRISELVLQSKPNAEINVHAPIQGDAFPDPDTHELVILTGGPFNLLHENKPSWVMDTLDYIKLATTNRAKPKILGICWGQQAIALALGGSLSRSERGHCIGVENISLTPDGAKFFNARALGIHKNHEIVVTDSGPRLSYLAPNNEILLSDSNQILTFQGHPEMDQNLSRLFVATDDPSSSLRPGLKAGLQSIDAPHDGELIFRAIIAWALSIILYIAGQLKKAAVVAANFVSWATAAAIGPQVFLSYDTLRYLIVFSTHLGCHSLLFVIIAAF